MNIKAIFQFNYSSKDTASRVIEVDKELYNYIQCLEAFIKSNGNSKLLEVYPALKPSSKLIEKSLEDGFVSKI